MKKLFYLFAVLMLSFPAFAQLQNLDFENWDGSVNPETIFHNNPTGWICTNRWYGTEDVQYSPTFNLPIATNAQNGDYAIKLFVWYNYMKDAAVQTAPINTRPLKLTGSYKYEENFIYDGTDITIDTAQVVVILTKWNAALDQRDTIGSGILNIYAPTSVYKNFEVTIDYVSDLIPDSITVLLDPSIVGRYIDNTIQNLSGGGTSTFTVDNLALVEEITAGINDLNDQGRVILYPNPTTGQVHFEDVTGDGYIYDITGKQVHQFRTDVEKSIDVSHLNQGTYIIKIKNDSDIHTGKLVKL